MSKQKCKFCNMSFISKRGYNWHSNGTWGKKKGLLIIFIGKEELLNIFKTIEGRLGQPIDKLVRLSKRIVTVNVVNEELLGRAMKLFFNLRIVGSKILNSKMNNSLTKPIGWGFCKKIEINRRDKVSTFYLKNYPSIPLIEGAVSGLSQYLFSLNSVKITSKEEEGLLKVVVSPREKESELAKYVPKPVSNDELNLLPGDINYDLCPNCKVPKKFADLYEWDMKEGIIVNQKTNKEHLLFTRYALEAILGLIEKELGKEIPKIILDAEKRYIKNNFSGSISSEVRKCGSSISGNSEENYRSLIDRKEFGVKGWGDPVEVKKEGKTLKVRINNPFYEAILVGFVAGCYEVIEGVDSKVYWESKGGYISITVLPNQ